MPEIPTEVTLMLAEILTLVAGEIRNSTISNPTPMARKTIQASQKGRFA